jgi:hypothetical protein
MKLARRIAFGSMNGRDALETACPLFPRKQTWIGTRMEADFR